MCLGQVPPRWFSKLEPAKAVSQEVLGKVGSGSGGGWEDMFSNPTVFSDHREPLGHQQRGGTSACTRFLFLTHCKHSHPFLNASPPAPWSLCRSHPHTPPPFLTRGTSLLWMHQKCKQKGGKSAVTLGPRPNPLGRGFPRPRPGSVQHPILSPTGRVGAELHGTGPSTGETVARDKKHFSYLSLPLLTPHTFPTWLCPSP